MIVIIALVLVVSSMNSCTYPEIEFQSPDPVKGAVLLPGEYRVEAQSVSEVDCRGASKADFIGQVAYGTLKAEPKVGEYAVRFDLDGVPMKGRMEAGLLSVHGALDVSVPEMDEGTDSAEASAEVSDSGSSSDDCTEGESEDTQVEQPAEDTGSGGSGSGGSGAVAKLQVVVFDDSFATGMLTVRTEDCSYLLGVTLDREVEGAPTEPVEDTGSQPYPGDDNGSQPCRDDADCG